MKCNLIVKISIAFLISMLWVGMSFAQKIAVPTLYVGTNRVSLDSKYDVLNPGWGGQIGFNVKFGGNWIQFDGSLEFDIKGLRGKYNQTMTSESGRKLESNNSITSYALHTTIPLGLSIGYYKAEDDEYGNNVFGASVVGGGFIDFGIWGQNRITQENRLSNQSQVLFEESNVYSQNCFGSSSLQRKRFDAGIYVGVAATTSILGISIIYRKGFLNVSNLDNFSCKNNGLYINLTFNCTYEN